MNQEQILIREIAENAWQYTFGLRARAKATAEEFNLNEYPTPNLKQTQPLIQLTIDHMGGWTKFCAQPITIWTKKEFIITLESYAISPEFEKLNHQIPEPPTLFLIENNPAKSA